jgi:hypothetical protein
MALEEYLGAIVMEIDGQEVEVKSLDATVRTGRKLVKTMNRTGRAKGFARGITEYDLRVTAVIPASGDIDWGAIEGAQITIYPQSLDGERIRYQDCFTLEVGDKYNVDDEAVRDITMAALNRVTG